MIYNPYELHRLFILVRQLKVANAKEYRFRMITENGYYNDKKDMDRAHRIREEQLELIKQDINEIKQIINRL